MDSSDAIRPISVTERRGAISREVLESLPEWFGIPASVENYITAADELRMLACFGPAGEVIGFVSIKTHTPFAAEVYAMGVKRPWHRRGIGRGLIEAVVELAISLGIRFLTVKTLRPQMTIKITRELGCSTRLLVFSRLRNSRPCGGLRTHVYLCFDCCEGGARGSNLGAEVAVLCPRVR
jgi:GNAT superfamily N-acetyltransferase